MAVRHGYGKIAGTDALVFAYDTGDTRNSYRGEPTTNVNPYTLSQSGTDGSGQGSVGTRTILSDNHVRIVDVNSNTRQTHLIEGLTGGTTYTISIEFKKLSGAPTFRFQIQNYLNGAYQSTIKFTNTAEIGLEDKDGWQTASWTFTLGAGMNGVRIWYQDGADYTTYTHSFELRNPQLEAKSHATPYTPPLTTRSATQGLLDLTGNNTIDLSNVSFDNNAQKFFDGTDDTVVISGINLQQNFTLEAVVKMSQRTSFGIFGQGTFNTNQGLHILYNYGARGMIYGMYSNDNDYGGNWIGELNQYYHVVFTYDNSTYNKEFYANGALQTPASSTENAYLGTGDMRIGMIYGPNVGVTAPAYGDIPSVKIYNRVLTADEVRNNYRHYKNRFNIS